ncbi:mannosyltransferase family protein [Paenibacillus koleovorans]|uniref:mannosyltransferase family protein n=1 Tax=Paenibacillus koleovorans TaxID=121608 RepID=UPI0013E331A4|nr:mannosyltransferase family protein [Paenibacillus koleovorans]
METNISQQQAAIAATALPQLSPETTPTRDAKPIRFLVTIFILTRILIYVTAYFGMNLFSFYDHPSDYKEAGWPGSQEQMMLIETEMLETKVPIRKTFMTADTFAYVNMAESGYDNYKIDEPHPPANWVFFPMFPLAMRAVMEITPSSLDPIAIGLILSNLFLLAAMIFFYKIAILRGLKDMHARIVVCLLLIAPAALFFAVPYTESLFLMLALGAVYFSMTRNWLPAFLLAGLTTVTRNVGAVIFLYTFCSMLLHKGIWRFHWRDWRLLLYVLLGCVPLASYLGYMKWLTGDFLAPLNEQINWGRHTTLPFVSYIRYLKHPYFGTSSGWENGLISFAIATAVLLVFIAYALVKRGKLFKSGQELLLYGTGLLLVIIPFSSGEHLASIPRYMTVCFPFYLYLVEMLRRQLTAVAGYALFSFMFHFIFIIGYFNRYLFVF